jgi:hypothetical protein
MIQTNIFHEMVVIIRPSFKKLCGEDACCAALFNHLLYWIAQKARGEQREKIRSGEVCWYGSYEDICHTGLDNSWGMWKVRKELKSLVDRGLIGQRHNPARGFDRQYQYFFGESQGKVLRSLCEQQGINLLELGLVSEVLHLLKTADACAENSQCIDRKQQMHVLNSSDPSAENSRAIPKDSTKVPHQETAKRETSTSENKDQMTTKGSNVSTEGQPQGKPVMPGDDIAWGPEKMVQITECLRFCRSERGAFFSTQASGKSQKSQRDRQLLAAKKIFAEIPTLTQGEYVAAYSEQNNEWWNREKGSLTVEDMAANTPRKVMRTLELLEKVRTRSQSIKRPKASVVLPVGTKPTSKADPMNHDQACQLADQAVREAKDLGREIQVQAVSLENGAWGIVVRWNTQYFEKPETMKSARRWESALKEMNKIWAIENQERMKRANNG